MNKNIAQRSGKMRVLETGGAGFMGFNLLWGFAWLDTGNHQSMRDASDFVVAVEWGQGHVVACLEETAFNQAWLTKEKWKKTANDLEKTPYGEYLPPLFRSRA